MFSVFQRLIGGREKKCMCVFSSLHHVIFLFNFFVYIADVHESCIRTVDMQCKTGPERNYHEDSMAYIQ